MKFEKKRWDMNKVNGRRQRTERKERREKDE